MTGSAILLAYASWAVAPVVAYAVLCHGLRGAWRGFLGLFGVYSLAVGAIALSLPAKGPAVVLRHDVIFPWMGAAALSAGLYALGAMAGRRE
ncbi:hypothetical protein C8N32_11910 [Rhodovulum imhoffii]|uniref:Integral membrane protein n=1 Tax=Rhodovulum imhoffii TaxID=365340 RepID=A0A2T5BPI4_9RHOB|nr:hypothetical protein [Rhodovulum imhoffii]MBK5932891.1 hypothetical protein [Rhodovulum imhoffii]PTN00953.1 hypothetical protein C8N32_11910 [Rhodovulum imhoffii]